ncbi:hypothetical protein [Thioclava sp. GXIMD4215]|uniref:hypothetical protein n=1 Tax=Thioclava sp. GXIMD4215 TaxID=3131928 RepID=UPI00325646DC
MKRKALLMCASCTVKTLESYTARGISPIHIEDRNWNDYTLEQALQLRLMVQAAKSMDNDSAGLLARRAVDMLYPFTPFTYTGQDMFVALVRYDWPSAPEGWDCRQVVAGRWEDLHTKAQEFVTSLDDGATLRSIEAYCVTDLAKEVWEEAHELGLPEGEAWPAAVSEDLTGYPEWFKEHEIARRKSIGLMPEDGE